LDAVDEEGADEEVLGLAMDLVEEEEGATLLVEGCDLDGGGMADLDCVGCAVDAVLLVAVDEEDAATAVDGVVVVWVEGGCVVDEVSEDVVVLVVAAVVVLALRRR